MLRQIKQDAAFLKGLIASLRSDQTTVTSNGVKLTGEQLESTLAKARASNAVTLEHLELIIESGIIPDKYTSIITKQTYYPTKDELKIKEDQVLPQGKHTFFCLKEKRKPEGLKNSRIKLVRDDGSQIVTFFMEHKTDGKYPKGGFAKKVKQGSLSEGNGEPKYAIKIYHKNMFNGETIHELRLAMRAAYCYKQLGREGYAFRENNKQYLVTEWLSGSNLDVADQAQIQSMPIPRRIVMAISLLRELQLLHKQGLIHNDIKPSNVMINFGRLRFVDLDSVRPKNEKPLFGTTPLFTEAYLPDVQMMFDATYDPESMYLKFNEQTDLYALGLTLAHLFQEIYIPKQEKRTINANGGPVKTFDCTTFSLQHGPKYTDHPELQKIIKNMVFQENDELKSCVDYIDALLKVLKTYPDYVQYLAEDRLFGLGANLTANDGKAAFKDIEIELLGYNQRVDAVVQKLRF